TTLDTTAGSYYGLMRRYRSELHAVERVIDYPWWKWQPILKGIILTKRPFTSGANYKMIWNEEANESPMLTLTKRQIAALQEACAARWGEDVLVDFCMRYGNPSTPEVLERMIAAGCRRIVFLPLYPQ